MKGPVTIWRQFRSSIREIKGLYAEMRAQEKEYDAILKKNAQMEENLKRLSEVKAAREKSREDQTLAGLRDLKAKVLRVDNDFDERDKQVKIMFDNFQDHAHEVMKQQMEQRKEYAKELARQLAADVPSLLVGNLKDPENPQPTSNPHRSLEESSHEAKR